MITRHIIHWDDGDVKTGIAAIEIQEGPFAEVVYRYQTVGFSEENPPTLKFKYIILENPEGLELEGNVDFINVIGDILQDIISTEMDKAEDGTRARNSE